MRIWLRKTSFFWLLLAAFAAIDLTASAVLEPYFLSSGRFIRNDYEIVRAAHPEEVWDRVFFGNSIVISAFLEEESESGYVNLGVDYGVVADLWDMVRQGEIQIGGELVIGLNDLTLYDEFPTNPGYPWHKKPWEPFLYFRRDRLQTLFFESVSQALTGFDPEYGKFQDQARAVYHGSLSQAQLDEKAANSKYLALPMEDFEKNFQALAQLTAWCRDNGVRLRALWMPLNPDFDVPESTLAVKARTRSFCEENGVGWEDWSGRLDRSCFYDFGHLNREYGAHIFTKEIDPWLLS